MQTLEVILLVILLLFPVIDLALEKYKCRNKSAEYIKLSLMLWTVAGLLIFCFLSGALTISAPSYFPDDDLTRYLAGTLVLSFILYLLFVTFSINNDENVRRHVLTAYDKSADSLIEILPETTKEYLLFTLLVAVSAGICEELIFRWYLYSMLEQQGGWLIAMIGSSVLFGCWHFYLGWIHVFKTSLIGAVLCGLYLYFDSIVVVIVVHILMDVYAGTVAFVARKVRT